MYTYMYTCIHTRMPNHSGCGDCTRGASMIETSIACSEFVVSYFFRTFSVPFPYFFRTFFQTFSLYGIGVWETSHPHTCDTEQALSRGRRNKMQCIPCMSNKTCLKGVWKVKCVKNGKKWKRREVWKMWQVWKVKKCESWKKWNEWKKSEKKYEKSVC